MTEISDLWENTENACKTRKNDLAEVFKLAEHFEKSHGAVCEWLDVTEKKLEKVPSVGSDVKAVKKQLDAQRVSHNSDLRRVALSVSWMADAVSAPLHPLLWVRSFGSAPLSPPL